MAQPKAGAGKPRGTISGTSQSLIRYTVRTVPLPQPLVALLTSNVALLQRLVREGDGSDKPSDNDQDETAADQLDKEEEAEAADGEALVNASLMRSEDFHEALKKTFAEVGGEWKDLYESVWMFGPHGSGSNILLDRRPADQRHQQCVTRATRETW